eukprot:754970-Hanusia_phi.AAC.6
MPSGRLAAAKIQTSEHEESLFAAAFALSPRSPPPLLLQPIPNFNVNFFFFAYREDEEEEEEGEKEGEEGPVPPRERISPSSSQKCQISSLQRCWFGCTEDAWTCEGSWRRFFERSMALTLCDNLFFLVLDVLETMNLYLLYGKIHKPVFFIDTSLILNVVVGLLTFGSLIYLHSEGLAHEVRRRNRMKLEEKGLLKYTIPQGSLLVMVLGAVICFLLQYQIRSSCVKERDSPSQHTWDYITSFFYSEHVKLSTLPHTATYFLSVCLLKLGFYICLYQVRLCAYLMDFTVSRAVDAKVKQNVKTPSCWRPKFEADRNPLVAVTAEWKARMQELVSATCKPGCVGKGRNNSNIGHAWFVVEQVFRIENHLTWDAYSWQRERVKEQMKKNGVKQPMTPVETARSWMQQALEQDEESNEVFLLHGTEADCTYKYHRGRDVG